MNNHQRKTILLENPLPLKIKKIGSSNKSLQKITTIKEVDATQTAELQWQVQWMNMYHSSREELNVLLSNERSENRENVKMIEHLNQKLKLKEFMIRELKSNQTDTHNKETRSTQTNVKVVGSSTQTDLRAEETQATQTSVIVFDSYTQTDTCAEQTQSTQTDVKVIDSSTQIDIGTAEESNQSEEPIHDEAKKTGEKDENLHFGLHNMMLQSIAHDHFGMVADYPPLSALTDAMTKKYSCDKCDFTTNKKSTYDDHYEVCAMEVDRNMKCPVCDQMHTYRTLRLHLNHYASGKCQPTGNHAKYSPAEHYTMLEEHKKRLQKKEKKPQKNK